MTRTTITEPKPEKATAYITATITDSDGVTALTGADTALATLTMTVYEEYTGTVINSCTDRSVLNANGGTVSSAGALSVRLDPLDMACITTSELESHVALFEWTWGTPTKSGWHEVAFKVANALKVT